MEQEIAIYVKLEFHMILLKTVYQYSIASTINNCPSDIKCKLYRHSLSGLIWYVTYLDVMCV